LLDGVEQLIVPFRERDGSAHHLAVVVLPEGVDRDRLRQLMRKQGIQTSVHYPPIHSFSAYAHNASRRHLPRTDAVSGRLLTLPLYPHLLGSQVEAVADALLTGLATAPARSR
jgi:dTDP-4-amino-4,6-dideoxygalactose transaminase